MYTIDRFVHKSCPDCKGKGCDSCDYSGHVADRERTDAEMARMYLTLAEGFHAHAYERDNDKYWRESGDEALARAVSFASVAASLALVKLGECAEAAVDYFAESKAVG